jgi:hypothetical protein
MSRSLGVRQDLARPQSLYLQGFSSVVSGLSGENLEVRGTNRGTQLSTHTVFAQFSDFLSETSGYPKNVISSGRSTRNPQTPTVNQRLGSPTFRKVVT